MGIWPSIGIDHQNSSRSRLFDYSNSILYRVAFIVMLSHLSVGNTVVGCLEESTLAPIINIDTGENELGEVVHTVEVSGGTFNF